MKYINNRLNANIIKLEDANNNYTSENVEGALEEIDSKIKNIEDNGYDDTQIRQDINNIKTEIGTEELTTTDKTIKGAVNEVNLQIKEKMNKGDSISVNQINGKLDQTYMSDKFLDYILIQEDEKELIIGKEDLSNVLVTSLKFLIDRPLPSGVIKKLKLQGSKENSVINISIAKKLSETQCEILNTIVINADNTFKEYTVNIPIDYDDSYIVIGGDLLYSANSGYTFYNVRTSGYSENLGTFNMNKSGMLAAFSVSFYVTELKKVKEAVKSLEDTKKKTNYIITDNPVDNLNNMYIEKFNDINPKWIYTNCSVDSGSITLQGDAKAYFNRYFTFDTYYQKSIVTINNISSKFGLMCYHSDKGALYLVDGVSKSIKLFKKYSGDAIPDTIKAETALDFDLVQGQKYILEVVKTGWKHTFKITCTRTLKTASVTFDNSTQSNSGNYCGKGWGSPGIICFEGDVTYHNHIYDVALFPSADAIFIGDSITEGTNMGANVDINLRWCSQLRKSFFKNNAMICGRGGDNTSGVIARLNDLYSVGISSKYVIVLIGTNQRSDSGLVKWKEEIEQIHDLIIANDAIPVICVPPIPASGSEYILSMRDFILEKGWNTIRFDYATSLDRDGVTYDSSMFTDGIHPGEKGNNAMFNQGMVDLKLIDL